MGIGVTELVPQALLFNQDHRIIGQLYGGAACSGGQQWSVRLLRPI